MSWRWLSIALVAGCAHASVPPAGPHLVSQVAAEQWYVPSASCSQGPFELAEAAAGTRWGEAIQLVASSPRRLRLTAVVEVGDKEVSRETVTVDPHPGVAGSGSGRPLPPENQRCVAGAVELAGVLGGGGGAGGGGAGGGGAGGGGGGTPGVAVPTAGGGAPSGPAPRLDLDVAGHAHVSTAEVIGFSWRSYRLEPPGIDAGARIRIRFWSSVPNDLDGVSFGLIRTVERPSVSDADYEAFIRAGLEQERLRAQREQERERAERERERQRAATAPPRREPERAPEPDHTEERLARARREAEARAERERRREAYCAAHHEDTSCWGPGGFAVHADLERRKREREAYCAAHVEEARCWTPEQWSERERHAQERIRLAAEARRAPPEPKGPPPAPQAETQPPTPSLHADWRPGYWYWNGGDWVWIAGAWHVPDADVSAELTAQAPVAPPALAPEPLPAPPAASAVWTPGYWAWSGNGYLWIQGSWQLPPAPRLAWRPTTWEARGSGVILRPGGWISVTVP